MSENNVRVRFAPSPTGYLHIGGARTALFNYLYARSLGGKFLLRIEDTDLERSSASMIQQIQDSMSWLGMSPDEDIVLQSRNKQAHFDAVETLLKEEKAYRCFCSKEELDAERAKAKEKGEAYRYSQKCRHLNKNDIAEKLQKNLTFTVRLKIPDGITRFKDAVYKKIEVNNSEIDDFILLRSDGSPVYQLAVVVDDIDMNITHIIRGEDHLSNTAKHILLYLALGAKVPKYAHLPLILGSDGKRLSKRYGATSVGEFKELGFTPEGVINSLVLLGWSHKSNKTIFDVPTLIKDFDLSRISKKGAIFDLDKMKWVNGQHLSLSTAESLFERVTKIWLNTGLINESDISSKKDYLLACINLLKQRLKLLPEFSQFGYYMFKAPEDYDPEMVEKHWKSEQILILMEMLGVKFKRIKNFTPDNLESELRQLSDEFTQKAAILIHALRLAMTGFGVSPDIFHICQLIGKEETLVRLEKAILFIKE